MKSFCLFLVLICGLATSVSAANEPERPRLVVNIVIDGFQPEHLTALWNLFDKGGFRRLYSQGAVCRHAYYPILSNGATSDYATIVCGTTPYDHGITGDRYYDNKTGKLQLSLIDPAAAGIGTPETLSPKSLLASTVSDELKMNSGGKSHVFAIGINSQETIMLAGHAADGAVWIDNASGNFATSSFYPLGLPRWADQMNVDHSLGNAITTDWVPLYPINTYLFPPKRQDPAKGFAYSNTGTSTSERVLQFKRTPFVNQTVKDVALKALEAEKLGQGGNPDYLGLQFSLQMIGDDSFELLSAEKEDMYLRLDKYLAELIEKIDQSVGLSHTLFVVTGSQGDVHSQNTLSNYKISGGTFSPSSSMALLNLYLMAIYGQSQWVAGYFNKNIYLDHTAIEKKGISMTAMQQHCADFMLELQGVQAAFTTQEILHFDGKGHDEHSRLKNSYNKNHSGDVIFTLMPGWVEADASGNIVTASNRKESYVPLILFGYSISSQTITSANVTDIAPTISNLLHITSPNACTGRNLTLVLNEVKH
ncbi:MAG: type phosphodiesterase/nucleotide pyrophosphatase [Bacteroidetes bacterium]|nr:type phosphodiesterase/nucleotide pyrophosphatase [Bacteroidota bacterium]